MFLNRSYMFRELNLRNRVFISHLSSFRLVSTRVPVKSFFQQEEIDLVQYSRIRRGEDKKWSEKEGRKR